MQPRASLPFLVSGLHENDMGMLKCILTEFGPEGGDGPTFVERWSPTTVEFSPDRYAGLVILGDSYFRATSSKYDRERRWLQTALDAGRPIMAICYGAQLLAAVRNGKPNPCGLSGLDPWHGGVVEVKLEGAGESDPVLEPLRDSPLVTMSHEDCFQEPKGTKALAWSACAGIRHHCEAFRVGEPDHAVYGLQFHPEPTVRMLQAERKRERWFDVIPPEEVLQGVAATGEKILRAWAWRAASR